MTTSRQSGRKPRNVTPTAAKSRPAGTVKSTTGQPPVPVPETGTTTGTYSWTHDYDYVKKDLRRLAIVSAVLLLAIIILGFFI
jgi:hypothetical protein